jgi:hypothetical protein
MAKNPVRQHWVPQFYLRQFIAPDSRPRSEQVWIIHREAGEPRRTNIKNIAVEKHLYSPKRPDGSRDPALEAKLCDLEGTLATLWPQLATDFVDLSSTSIRGIIALFLSVQFLRHPERRDSTLETRKRILEMVEKEHVKSQGLPDIQRVQIGQQTYAVNASDWHNFLSGGDESSVDSWRKMIERDAMRYAQMLLTKRWSIVYTKDPLFVTSDYPLYVVQPNLKRFQVGGKDAMIQFPISPTRILCLDDLQEPENQYYSATESNADFYNLMTWVNTESFLISSRNPDEVMAGIYRVGQERTPNG